MEEASVSAAEDQSSDLTPPPKKNTNNNPSSIKEESENAADSNIGGASSVSASAEASEAAAVAPHTTKKPVVIATTTKATTTTAAATTSTETPRPKPVAKPAKHETEKFELSQELESQDLKQNKELTPSVEGQLSHLELGNKTGTAAEGTTNAAITDTPPTAAAAKPTTTAKEAIENDPAAVGNATAAPPTMEEDEEEGSNGTMSQLNNPDTAEQMGDLIGNETSMEEEMDKNGTILGASFGGGGDSANETLSVLDGGDGRGNGEVCHRLWKSVTPQELYHKAHMQSCMPNPAA